MKVYRDIDNLLLYLEEVAGLVRILTAKGEVRFCRRDELTPTTLPVLKDDVERMARFKVAISRSSRESSKPKTHPFVYDIRRVDETAAAKASQEETADEDLLLLPPADHRQG